LPKTTTWKDLPGYEVSTQPASAGVKVLRPDVPYNQFDGAFGTTGGSEPSYNLSSYLGTTYKNNRQVTLLTGPSGPGDQDLWMTGYLDGCNDIILAKDTGAHDTTCVGKISYLGGHQYQTSVPLTSGSESIGTRLFLNALFEADCVTGAAPNPGDTDGDGVPDGSDPDPTNPMICGDSNGDGCDDCTSGHYDPMNDCATDHPGDAGTGNPDRGDKSGCCDAGSAPGGALLLGAGVLGLVLRRRKR
jgi:hypothetical protein